MNIELNKNDIEVHVSEEVRKGLTELGIDVDKEIQQGIEQGLSNGKEWLKQNTGKET
jgi:BMFP domain-containing protein YqiC